MRNWRMVFNDSLLHLETLREEMSGGGSVGEARTDGGSVCISGERAPGLRNWSPGPLEVFPALQRIPSSRAHSFWFLLGDP